MFFYPKDFTFVCPTEITGFARARTRQFQDRDCQVLTGSTDSEFVHHAWRTHHKDLNSLPFPMLADIKRELTSALGILDADDGVAQRATFLVDPNGIIRFVYVTDRSRRPQPGRKCCACSTRCRPTSCARATGSRAKRRSRPPKRRLSPARAVPPRGAPLPRTRGAFVAGHPPATFLSEPCE